MEPNRQYSKAHKHGFIHSTDPRIIVYIIIIATWFFSSLFVILIYLNLTFSEHLSLVIREKERKGKSLQKLPSLKLSSISTANVKV